MRISIIIPSYNQAQFLDATIRSAVSQDYPDKEIIVLDGGSSDGSVEIIRKHERQLASWRSEPDGGQSNAIKAGFRMATGDLIGWVNSDDVLARGALARVARAVRALGGPDGVFYGGCEVIDADGVVQEVLGAVPTQDWIAKAIGPVLCQPGTFFGREAYFRGGEVDTSLQYAMDLDLWMRFITTGTPFVRIPAVQGQFRSHSLQKGHSREWIRTCIADEERVRQRYAMAPIGSVRRVLARQALRALRLTHGHVSTLAFRLRHHRRLRYFNVEYSS